jgi:twitching motility protein PilT
MPDLQKVLTELRKTGVSDLHVFPGEVCFSRRDGVLSPMPELRFSEDEVKKVILSTSAPKAREILGKHRQVNYSFQDSSGERYRFAVYFDKGKFAFSVRIIPAQPMKLQDLGLPDPIKKLLSKTSGLIIVGSPSGQGKTTTISAILEFINQHFEKNIITIENPVEITFKDQRSSFIQRSIPLDVSNFYEGLNEAFRMDPDIVVCDSLIYKDVLDQALFLCESGCQVIGAMDGGDCQKLLERILFSRTKEERETVRSRLMTHLNFVVCQRLINRTDSGRTAVFDIVVNTLQLKTILKGDNMSLLRTPQETDKESGMMTYERCLQGLINKMVVTPATAAAFFGEGSDGARKFLKK